jgi:hypothetical protein
MDIFKSPESTVKLISDLRKYFVKVHREKAIPHNRFWELSFLCKYYNFLQVRKQHNIQFFYTLLEKNFALKNIFFALS